jgi:hypothetical protein
MGLAMLAGGQFEVPVARASVFATSVAGYDAGSAVGSGFNDPGSAIGSPERFTGETDFGGLFQAVVSPFSPAFGTDEIVQIGDGGFLTLEFDEPITNDASHPFGVDFIVFGNGGFADDDFDNGTIGDPAATFGLGEMLVEVSDDGTTFHSLGSFTEGLYPAMGYVDAGPFDTTPGSVWTDFQQSLDPALTLADFAGMTYDQLLTLYDGSGGGTPVDIAASGLSEVSFVRFSVPGSGTVEIDAVSRVPEPTAIGFLLLGGLAAFRRARRG